MHAYASPPKSLNSDLLATGAAGGAAYLDLLGAWGGAEVLGRLDAIRMMLLQPDRCALPPPHFVPSLLPVQQLSEMWGLHACCCTCLGARRPATTLSCRQPLPCTLVLRYVSQDTSAAVLQAVGAVPDGSRPRAATAAVCRRKFAFLSSMSFACIPMRNIDHSTRQVVSMT